jgi:hypothetical protein
LSYQDGLIFATDIFLQGIQFLRPPHLVTLQDNLLGITISIQKVCSTRNKKGHQIGPCLLYLYLICYSNLISPEAYAAAPLHAVYLANPKPGPRWPNQCQSLQGENICIPPFYVFVYAYRTDQLTHQKGSPSLSTWKKMPIKIHVDLHGGMSNLRDRN